MQLCSGDGCSMRTFASVVGRLASSSIVLFPPLGLLQFLVHESLNRLREKCERDVKMQHPPEEGKENEIREVKLECLNKSFCELGVFELQLFSDVSVAEKVLKEKVEVLMDVSTGTLKIQLDKRTQLTLERQQQEELWQEKLQDIERNKQRALRIRQGTLLAACERCDFLAAQALIQQSSRWANGRKGFINAIDSESGNIALHIACLQGSWGISIADILLEAGADPTLRDQSASSSADTAFHYAARSGDINVLQLLCDHALEPWSHKGSMERRATERRRQLINLQGYRGRTPLDVACEYNDVAMVKWLLEHDASPAATKELQETPLHTAAYKGHTTISSCLLQARANPRALNANLQSPVFIAALNAHEPLAALYLDHGIWLSKLELKRLLTVADPADHQKILFMLDRALHHQIQSLRVPVQDIMFRDSSV